MSTSSKGHAKRFRRRLKRTGERGVRKNLQQGVYGDKGSTDAVLAREFLEQRNREALRLARKEKVAPGALKGAASAIRHSKDAADDATTWAQAGAAVAVGVFVLAALVFAKSMGWF